MRAKFVLTTTLQIFTFEKLTDLVGDNVSVSFRKDWSESHGATVVGVRKAPILWDSKKYWILSWRGEVLRLKVERKRRFNMEDNYRALFQSDDWDIVRTERFGNTQVGKNLMDLFGIYNKKEVAGNMRGRRKISAGKVIGASGKSRGETSAL